MLEKRTKCIKPLKMLHFRHIFRLTVLLIFIGCKPHVVREAEVTLAEADSLRVHGIPPTDSVRLAQTVADLSPWRYIYPTDYAKANYYYGRLLRAKGNYAASMECFINATHSRSKDYMWIGKAWTNIGDFCRSDGNYDLAYDVHVRAAEAFKRDNNTRAYYYELNNMAVVRVFQKDKFATTELLSKIENECSDSAILNKILETKALLCIKLQEYDSVIYYANLFYNNDLLRYAGYYILKAQSFWYLSQKDSALYYAQKAMACPCNKQDSVNMMYITSHNDPSVGGDSILIITSERADIQKALTNEKSSLSHAVEILQQDLARPYDWRWIYVLLGLVAIIGGFIVLSRAKRHHRDIRKERELSDISMYTTLENKCSALSQLNDKQLIETIYWKNYDTMCNYCDAHLNNIVSKLLKLNPTLTEQNIRLCILIIIGCSYNRIASLLNLSPASISKLKQILADKLNTSIKNLRTFLLKIASKNGNMNTQ